MAISNRDRIQKGFELLAEGIGPFVDEHMATAAKGTDTDWVSMIHERDLQKNPNAKKQSLEDPAFQLRMIKFENAVFKRHLSDAERAFAGELGEVRNKWAHNEKFSQDDTYRALDTMERLLQAVGATTQAELVRQIRQEHSRLAVEQETRKAFQQIDTTSSIAGAGVKPWRDVLQPHQDVASGNFSASEFAADLYMVSKGDGAPEYVDPVEFFKRTYLTEGLSELLDRGIRRITGDANASPIINLQTNFGGGKTHSMLALWHLFSGRNVTTFPQDIQELVANRELPKKVNRVALVGTHMAPGSQSVKPDGTSLNTMWGELAWQLGGAKAFSLVAEADRNRTNPGAALEELIKSYSPCLILIDEWVAYARQMWEREDLPGGTFDTQFTFAQTLTEVVKNIPGAMLVISIPASHDPERDGQSSGSALEVGGPNGQEALQRLQNVVRRVADQWRPASAQESFEIVRRRLFMEPSASALNDIAAVAKQFGLFYEKHKGEFPKECSDLSYEARIRAAYPIHPELFDRLYEDWSTLDRFQRTRGVLRLMSAVVHSLWSSQDAGPLIMAGSLPLDAPAVLSELTQYLPDHWKPILDADIDGGTSTPVKIDSERPTFGQRAITRRLARSIFVGSAPTLRSAHKGIERPRVWLGVAIPGDTVGNFGSALDLLSQRATYLYADGQRYWFDTQASVQRTATDMADRLRERPEEVHQEIVRRMRISENRNRGSFAGVHVAPDSTADIPDQDEARLVILNPDLVHSKSQDASPAIVFATQALDKRGNAQRINRNMLVFLAPDSKRMEELFESACEFLAWDSIISRAEELNLAPQQFKQAETRRRDADLAVESRISQTYIHALVPEQADPAKPFDWTVIKCDGSDSMLANRTSEKLARAGLLTDVASWRTIRMELDSKLPSIWDSGHISVGRLWELHCTYPYLIRMKDRKVLSAAISLVEQWISWQEEGFALAEGYSEESGTYLGLVAPNAGESFGQVLDTTLLVKPEVALAHLKSASQSEIEVDDKETQHDNSSENLPEAKTVPSIQNTSFYGVMKLDPTRYSRDLTRLGQDVLQHITSVEGVELEVTVEIRARRKEGFPSDKARVVIENAKSLKFEQSSFDD